MVSDLIFVTYADGVFERNLAMNCWFARVFGGAKRTLAFTRNDLEASSVYGSHRDVFDHPRGAGYWAWKPWAILEAMDASKPGDVIFYQDCGFGLRYKTFLKPRKLAGFARDYNFLAGVRCPQYGPNLRWNRRKCLEIMGADLTQIIEAPTVQATISFWSNTPTARDFVQMWLRHCLNIEAIRDATSDEIADEHPDFVEHRHDQAILTNLVGLRDATVISVQSATLDFAKSVSMIELDLRARNSLFYSALLRLIVFLANIRRNFAA